LKESNKSLRELVRMALWHARHAWHRENRSIERFGKTCYI